MDTALYDVDEVLVFVDRCICLPGKLCHECCARALVKLSSFGLQSSSSSKPQPDLIVCVQAVGLRSGYHTAIVMGGLFNKVHGMRLAQASEMLLELKAGGLHKGAAPMTHMQLDGEPWQQELPYEEGSSPMHVSEVDWLHWNSPLLEQNLCHLAFSPADFGSRT